MIEVSRALRIGSRINNSTSGSVLFVDSNNKIAEDNSNIFWNDTDKRLGILTNAPIGDLQVGSSTGSESGYQTLNSSGASGGSYDMIVAKSGIIGGQFTISRSDGNIGTPTEPAVGRRIFEFKGQIYESDISNYQEIGTFILSSEGDNSRGKFSFIAHDFGVDSNTFVVGRTSGTVVNETGINVDFRVEGSSEDKLLLVDAGNNEVRMGDGDTNYVTVESDGDVNFVAGAGLQYGEIKVQNNSTETTIAAAGTAVQVTVFDTNGVSNGDVTPDHTNDHITVGKAGHYLITISMTLNSIAGAGSIAEISCKKNNGNADVIIHMDRSLAGGGSERGVISLSGIADLAVNDTIEVWIENETNTQNYIVEDCSLSLVQTGGT
jgi:hypothetical protein